MGGSVEVEIDTEVSSAPLLGWEGADLLWLAGLLLSIPIGVLSNVIYQQASKTLVGLRQGRFATKTAWIEWVPNCRGRQFSIGTIKYSWTRRQYVFDGTNFRNDGSPYCHWRTVSGYIDYQSLEYHYVFATKDVASFQTTSFGYGVLALARVGNRLLPTGGSYMYSTGREVAVQFAHTMHQIGYKDVPIAGKNAARLLSRTLPNEWRMRRPR